MTSPLSLHLVNPAATRVLGEHLAGHLRAGDLLILTGELGAGKTTLTQGIGAALQVRGQIASPTFVIAREHPSTIGGPGLVHVDAYRLGGLDELDALDLDSSLEESVTIVEWGAGLAETLTEDRLEVRIERATGADEDAGRNIHFEGIGPRWADADLSPLAENFPRVEVAQHDPVQEPAADGAQAAEPASATDELPMIADPPSTEDSDRLQEAM